MLDQDLSDKFEYSHYLFAKIVDEYCREKLLVYHFWELRG